MMLVRDPRTYRYLSAHYKYVPFHSFPTPVARAEKDLPQNMMYDLARTLRLQGGFLSKNIYCHEVRL